MLQSHWILDLWGCSSSNLLWTCTLFFLLWLCGAGKSEAVLSIRLLNQLKPNNSFCSRLCLLVLHLVAVHLPPLLHQPILQQHSSPCTCRVFFPKIWFASNSFWLKVSVNWKNGYINGFKNSVGLIFTNANTVFSKHLWLFKEIRLIVKRCRLLWLLCCSSIYFLSKEKDTPKRLRFFV